MGVEQYLAAIDLATGRIRVALKLHTNLLEIIALERLTAVRAETEILLFNPDFSIFIDKGFPDITEQISIVDDKLEIRFMEGYVLTLDIKTGTISPESETFAASI